MRRFDAESDVDPEENPTEDRAGVPIKGLEAEPISQTPKSSEKFPLRDVFESFSAAYCPISVCMEFDTSLKSDSEIRVNSRELPIYRRIPMIQ